MTAPRIPARLSPGKRLALALAIGTCLVLAQAGVAHAGWWASVNYDGTLLKSRAVIANFRDATGLYRIVFRKNVDKCVPMVTLSGTYGFIRADVTGNPGEVAIQITNETVTSFIDGSFHIALIC